tara:strand:+ start:132 stop:812 length:681 start_codon:yes stop_codon:yes gene_type:complete
MPVDKPASGSGSGGGSSSSSVYSDIGGALGGIGSVIGAFNKGSGASSYRDQLEELEERIRRSTDELDRRATEYENKILGLQELNDRFTGKTTSDAVADYKKYFEDVATGLTSQYSDMLRNFRPDLSDSTSGVADTIATARDRYRLGESDAFTTYEDVISTDPRKIFPNALDFSAEVGYNQANPLITYMDDPDAVAMMNFGRSQVNDYTRAMTDGAGPGQSLMNYGV